MLVDLDNPSEQAKKAIIAKAMSELGKRGGKVGGKSTSQAKQTASRENGKKGGRPVEKDKVSPRP